MTVDVPPADDPEKDKTVEELLWDLLVLDHEIKLDPATGDIEPTDEKSS